MSLLVFLASMVYVIGDVAVSMFHTSLTMVSPLSFWRCQFSPQVLGTVVRRLRLACSLPFRKKLCLFLSVWSGELKLPLVLALIVYDESMAMLGVALGR